MRLRKTQRDQVEREVGRGIGMGNTCKPMAVSFQCMTKFTTNKKKKWDKKNFCAILLVYIIFNKYLFKKKTQCSSY